MNTILSHINDDKSLKNLSYAHTTSIHIAFIMKRGQIIAKATNKLGSRSRGCGYSNCTIHAERAVVKELGDLNQLKGATMYVIRIARNSLTNNETCIRNSEPCYDCHLFLKKCHEKYGLNKVFYSTQSFVELNFNSPPSRKDWVN